MRLNKLSKPYLINKCFERLCLSNFNFSILAFEIPVVNFINVKRANFSYKLCFSSYVLALAKKSYEKIVRKTLMKLTPVVKLITF